MVWVVLSRWRGGLVCCYVWIVMKTMMHHREPSCMQSSETKRLMNPEAAKLAKGKCSHPLRVLGQ